ncbi:molybdopterin-guanine dinucleotide biosynthesis protein B [bacterium DOLZORAL124_64_63]|nr:MAG: molybdopterin-guanine dinucleotide biosynthesis protein B [bacterium DOLZORAL124_64_63]
MVMAFVAWSGTGKTTLVESLVRLATARGLAVGTLKHDAHRFEIDRPGKDSHRLFAAGSRATMIVAEDKLALVRRHRAAPAVDNLIADHFQSCDLVLVEGWKMSALPRIEVHRPALGRPLLCREERYDPHLVAVASDAPLKADVSNLDVPVLDLNDPATVLDFILERRG